MNRRARSIFVICGLLLVWQVVASRWSWAGMIPTPIDIAKQIVESRSDYYSHIGATLSRAALGFAIGNLIAVLLVMITNVVPYFRPATGALTFLYSIPLILIVPLIGMLCPPNNTAVLGAILLVYYPTWLITDISLSQAPRKLSDVLVAFGGNDRSVFLKLRLRLALAGFVTGLKTSAPFALLGAMLGEMTGARWGLGAYLVAVMAQGRAAMLWGVFAVCTVLSVLIFEGIGVASDRLVRDLTGGLHPPSDQESSAGVSIRSVFMSVFWTLILWEIIARFVGLDIFIKSPSELARFSASLPHQDWIEFLAACTSTGTYAVLGLAAGLLVAFILAAICEFVPSLGDALVSFTLVSQAVPIVALIPLYVGLTGRGPFTVIAVVISATFFAAFMSIREGFRQVPIRLKEVLLSAGASRTFVFWHVTIPAAFPYLIGASRLAAPRVFLGVTLAEYLATRTGLGAMMFEARGKTDFGMMWLIAITAGLGSLGLAQITNLLAWRFSATRRTHENGRAESVNQEVETYS